MNNAFTRFIARRLCRSYPPERKPDFVIGGLDNPYMLRWYMILPRNPFLTIYVHQVLRSDDDRALHDHPSFSLSLMLAGPMGEWVRDGNAQRYREIKPGELLWRSGSFAHRLVRLPKETKDADGDTRVAPLTVFIMGPRYRKWGFWCPHSWRFWEDFVAKNDSGLPGRGCD
jgi:hypothetical protein